MSADPAPLQTESIEGQEVHYIKSTQFRVVYVEGAYGGITPHGMIEFAVYNERRPIPRMGTLHADAEQNLITEEITEGKSGLVREIETALMMTPDTAERLARWLDSKISEFAELKVPDAK
jgi:hypothetical protein